MDYMLKQVVHNKLLREVFDQERWESVLDWPKEVRGAWIHPAWTGDTFTTLEPDEPDGATGSEDRDASTTITTETTTTTTTPTTKTAAANTFISADSSGTHTAVQWSSTR
ncbi:hypothetical protein LY78DRAFT_686977 [Colletotrichum sublineola]|nr:hypothetical protein LY78DRAFT_686977 [Colletotrichum sublineola]